MSDSRGRGGSRRRGRGDGRARKLREDRPSGKGAQEPQPSARPVIATQAAALQHSAPDAAKQSGQPDFSTETFESLRSVVDDRVLDTLKLDLKYSLMTPVQAAAVPALVRQGIDCLVQAKTGSGKTFTFLLPAIQKMLSDSSRLRGKVSCLIITPTRELALQIEVEAQSLLQRLRGSRIRHAIGGTNKISEQKGLIEGCDILVATPGRLLDHLSEQSVVETLSNLQSVVLDEADRLLDMGFLPDLKRIFAFLPDRRRTPRQGMLFSATIADHVKQVAGLVLKENYQFISTIPAGEAGTHEKVPQTLLVVESFADMAPALVESVRNELNSASGEFKAIVFAQTAAMADWFAAIVGSSTPQVPCSVLHARLSQSKRTSITNAFSASRTSIIVATDVIARGMDFPNVTHVFQAGVPADRESYIHRLGRTARAGKDGRGYFIVTREETFFPEKLLKEVPFKVLAPYSPTPAVREECDAVAVAYGQQEKTYQAWLGYYKGYANKLRWSPAELVAKANEFSLSALRAQEVPALQRKTVGKMGLKGVPGLRLRANDDVSPSARTSGTSTPVRKVAGGNGRLSEDLASRATRGMRQARRPHRQGD
ncbi:hypothetical protein PYCC9005_001423 [Savitreella phatthalungensis]